MTVEELMFFNDWPQLIDIYEALREKLIAEYPSVTVRVTKTQISFLGHRMFAVVSLPVRRKKEWPRAFLMVTFGLGYRKESERIVSAVEAYPGRWTHHVIVETETELDGELMQWIHEALLFAEAKR